MSTMQVANLIQLWCQEEEWVSLAEDKNASPKEQDEVSMLLHVNSPDSFRRNPITIEVRQPDKSDRLLLENKIPIPGELLAEVKGGPGARVDSLLDHVFAFLVQRPGVLQVRMEPVENRVLLCLTLTIWLEGLNKHTFLTSLVEMDKTREVVNKLFREGQVKGIT